MKSRIVILISVCVTIACGCNTGSSTGPNSPVSWTVPGIGSLYVYRRVDSPYVEFDSMTVRSRGSALGKSNTITLEGIVVAYEPNGDISIQKKPDDTATGLWNRYPTSGGVIFDSVINFHDGNKFLDRITRTNVGTETITVAGSSQSAIKITEVHRAFNFDTAGVMMDTGSDVDYYWFVPQIGFFANQSEYGVGGTVFWNSMDLTAFKLR